MTKHKVGTQEEWRAARNALQEREQELGNLDEELAKQRQELPWVRVDTYSRTAPDRLLLAPYYDQLLDQIPAGRNADFPLHRHDEY